MQYLDAQQGLDIRGRQPGPMTPAPSLELVPSLHPISKPETNPPVWWLSIVAGGIGALAMTAVLSGSALRKRKRPAKERFACSRAIQAGDLNQANQAAHDLYQQLLAANAVPDALAQCQQMIQQIEAARFGGETLEPNLQSTANELEQLTGDM